MKINLLKMYPSELFFSWISRNFLLMGINQEHFLKLMFNEKTISLYKVKPFNNLIAEKEKQEYLELLKNNSILTILQPFITKEKLNEIIERNGTSSIMNTSVKGYRICPLCYQQDMMEYGETYLRTEHQVEGNYVCYIHAVDLVEIEAYKQTTTIKLFESRGIEEKLYLSYKYDESIYNEISKMIYQIINQKEMSNISLETVRKKYCVRLRELGYYRHSIINQKKLVNDFKKYYDDKLSMQIGCFFEKGNEWSWIRNIVVGTHQGVSKPIHHLLLIKFLFGNLENLLLCREEYTPFGVGPWKCINPICEKYMQTCIENIVLSKGDRSGRVRGEWHCIYCGMKYSRIGPVEEVAQIYSRALIIEYGRLWIEKFIKVCSDQNIGINNIAIEMKCSVHIVKAKMKELGVQSCCVERTLQELIMEKRNILIEEVKSNPYINRKELKNKYINIYTFLVKNDKQWIESSREIPTYSKNIPNQQANEKFWTEKDEEIEGFVRMMLE